MASTKIKGFVISKIEYGENDLIIKLITSHNVISFIALGARKIQSKNGKALTLGNYIMVEVFLARLTSSISKLKKAEVIETINFKNTNTIKVLMVITKYLAKMETSNPTIFSNIKQSFIELGNSHDHQIKTWIIEKTLENLGIKPIYSNCVECHSTKLIADFDFFSGGLLCKKHKRQTLSLSLLKGYINLNKKLSNYISTSAFDNKIIFENLQKYITENIFV